MNTSMLMGSWNEIKGKIKTQWAKLNDDDLEELKGNLDQLAGKIQKVYGYGKEQAEIEFNEFKKSITTSVSAATTTVMEKVDQLMDGDKNKKPEETKTKTTLSFVGAILLTGMMSACSHGPVVQEFADTANPTVEVGNLNSDINTAITNQVDVLSPKNFNEVNSSLQSAKKNLEKNKDAKKTLHEVAEGRAYLTIANQFSKTARANIEEVVLARQSAMDAGAVGYFGNEMKKTDRELMDVTSEMENNNLKDATENRAELQTSYRDLELKSIKETNLAHARDTINLAIKEGAKDLAPRTLAIAQKSMLDTEAYINANRHNNEELQIKSKESSARADHVLKITRNAKLGKKTSAEDSALNLESEQNKLASKSAELGKTQDQLNFKRTQLSDQQKEANALSEENRDLSSDQAFNRRFEEARAEFSSSEAEVYKQGNNLMIRLRGLEFPSSKAVLTGANLPLLAKVQKVINDFEDSSVIVEGHTDSVGGKQVNQKLSSERAEAVKQYFVSNAGSSNLDIKSVGYGYQKPLATNKTASGRAQNRRVDVVIQTKSPAQL
jgi:OOP family OmpA-OmpF porin